MMPKLFILLLLVLTGHALLAQTNWEATEATLKDSSEAATVKFYLAASKGLYVSNKTTGKAYAQKALNITRGKDAFIGEFGDANNMMGVYSMVGGRYDEADKFLRAALSTGRENRMDGLILKAISNLALNSVYRGDYQDAVIQYLDIIKRNEANGADDGLGKDYANLSNAYYYLDQYDKALYYQEKALVYFQKFHDLSGVANAYNTIGTCLTDLKQFAEAERYLNKSISLKKQLHDSLGLANAYNNLADVYHRQKRPDMQAELLNKAMVLFQKLDMKQELGKAYANLGAYYSNKHQYDLATSYERKAIELAKDVKDPYFLTTVYGNLSKSYEGLKQADTALAFSKKAMAAKDSLIDLTLQKQINELETRYQTAEKEAQISKQQQALSQADLRAKEQQLALVRRNYIMGGLVLIALLASIAAYALYRRRQFAEAARYQEALRKEQERSSIAILKAEEQERMRIAKDLHDGVGQMMSAARMNLSSIRPSIGLDPSAGQDWENILALVDDSCREIRSVSHNLMPNMLLKAGLGKAVEEFVKKTGNRQLKVDLYMEGLEKRLDPAIEMVLYRVIQESVNNVIKHAEASRLDISIIRDVASVSVTVEDNGKGFDLAEKKQAGGMGLSNMETRVQYLKGSLEFDTAPGKGTVLVIHIPLNASAAA